MLDLKRPPSFLDLPNHSAAQGILARILGLRAASIYYNSLPTSDGLLACSDRILADHGFDIAVIRAASSIIPERGALLITSNHPTGILDGILLLSALLSRRDDVRIVANDVLCRIPVLESRVIPIRKSDSESSAAQTAFLAIRRAWKNQECVLVFPAGTVAHWQWQLRRIEDAPWSDRIQYLAARSNTPEFRATLSVRNPLWFHCCAAVSRKARTALLLRAFFSAINNQSSQPVAFEMARSEQGKSGATGVKRRQPRKRHDLDGSLSERGLAE